MLYGGYDKIGFTRRDLYISIITIRWTQLLLAMLKQSSVTWQNADVWILISSLTTRLMRRDASLFLHVPCRALRSPNPRRQAAIRADLQPARAGVARSPRHLQPPPPTVLAILSRCRTPREPRWSQEKHRMRTISSGASKSCPPSLERSSALSDTKKDYVDNRVRVPTIKWQKNSYRRTDSILNWWSMRSKSRSMPWKGTSRTSERWWGEWLRRSRSSKT